MPFGGGENGASAKVVRIEDAKGTMWWGKGVSNTMRPLSLLRTTRFALFFDASSAGVCSFAPQVHWNHLSCLCNGGIILKRCGICSA